MRELTPDDVLPLDDYLARREEIRPRALRARAVRRVRVGDRISIAFENRDTLLHQIQEMVRVESIRDPAKVAEEVAVYNDLVAGEDELRATFFVEITDRERIREDLDSLIGLEREGLWLQVGEERVPAEFEPGHAREDRISAVHFVRFALPAPQARAIRERTAPVRIVVDHPGARAEAVLDDDCLAALADDLGGRPGTAGPHAG